jgi:inosose dehydratase
VSTQQRSNVSIRVGNAPVSWAVYEADRPNPPYGLVLDQIAAAGYGGTELGPYGYLPRDPETLAAELRQRRLQLGSSFVPIALEEPGRRAAAVAHALEVGSLLASQGVRELILADDEDPRRTAIAGRVTAADGWSDAQWTEAVATVNAVAGALRARLGMGVVLHHHAGTFVETPDEIARFLAARDPDTVGLLLDTGHAVYGGGDPAEIARRHGGRIRYVHLKDARAPELERVRRGNVPMSEAWSNGVFCPLGDGVVDFPAVMERLREHRYDGWVIVEQDVVPAANGTLVPEPFASAKRSRAYLRETLGL